MAILAGRPAVPGERAAVTCDELQPGAWEVANASIGVVALAELDREHTADVAGRAAALVAGRVPTA
ncbi:hypothetical protein EV191_101413 [Tamaricihabitans halophyticus]|uniref:Uncharacterized protein n=1 Tax=Tamaricihabitans halophyticus TaxID=1262583 RepID=A0A4R2R1B5_9PSEU|nr:hypothetical protein [Tamaricihabitans halophyticus]TCP56470.1 hypothetical protein EV191_101413 [Tamaricihabitans halophyticus]